MDLVSMVLALITAGASGATAAFSKKAGEAAFEKCSALADRLLAAVRSKADKDQRLRHALDHVLATPSDVDSRRLLGARLREMCGEDSSFARDLECILQEGRRTCGDSILQVIEVQQGATARITGKITYER